MRTTQSENAVSMSWLQKIWLGSCYVLGFLGIALALSQSAILSGVVLLLIIVGAIYGQRPRPRTQTILDQRGIRRERSGAILEGVFWDELERITIMTTDEGPFAEDFFFMFYGSEGGVAVPNGDAVELNLLDVIGGIDGFDHMAVVLASGSTDWNEFLCWEGNGPEAARVIRKALEKTEPDDDSNPLLHSGDELVAI